MELPLNSIPITEQEFSKSLDELRREYSDVTLFEKYIRGFPPVVGDIDQLEEKWGKAQVVEKKWWKKIGSTLFGAALVAYSVLPVAAFVVIEAIFIYPEESHHWIKNDTHIEAHISKIGLHGYERKLILWEWEKCSIESNSNLTLEKCM